LPHSSMGRHLEPLLKVTRGGGEIRWGGGRISCLLEFGGVRGIKGCKTIPAER